MPQLNHLNPNLTFIYYFEKLIRWVQHAIIKIKLTMS